VKLPLGLESRRRQECRRVVTIADMKNGNYGFKTSNRFLPCVTVFHRNDSGLELSWALEQPTQKTSDPSGLITKKIIFLG
jgi:hypothetical protein